MKTAAKSDRIISRMRNNPVVASLIVLGTIIIGISTFTDAAKNLIGVFKDRKPDVTGSWTTPVLTNPFDAEDKFTYRFQLEPKGDALVGSVITASAKGEYKVSDGILDGKITGKMISFHIAQAYTDGDQEVHYRDLFHGEVSGDEIQFTMESDRPSRFPPQTFKAKRGR